ncbi:acyl carrier protein [Lacibacterium aquatile]|uniref:Acyl carrier protein n=1 Tax=Lacibacterium aquatile TaxID=1168082 RepID=A0ABW5DU07_9PROT
MIDPADIFRDVVEMIQSTLSRQVTVTPETRIASDLGLDSVAVMDFVMELEDRFDVSISLDRIAEIEAVGDLVRTIGELKGHAAA